MKTQVHGAHRLSVAGAMVLLLALPGAAWSQRGGHHGGGHSSHHGGSHYGGSHYGGHHYGGHHYGYPSFHGYLSFYSYPYYSYSYGYPYPYGYSYDRPYDRGYSSSYQDSYDDRPARTVSPDLGLLHVEVMPRDASVYLDDRFVGTGRELAAAEDLELEPGEHVLEVVRPGYQTRVRHFTIEPGRRIGQQLDLDPH